MTHAQDKAIFVDRDGTLNEMVYNETHGLLDSPRRPRQVVAVRDAAAFLKGGRRLGYRIVVVSNQPGLAKGTLTGKELAAVNVRLAGILARKGGYWDEFCYCPHHPKGGKGGVRKYIRGCSCRKPKPGMLLKAAKDLHINLRRSWMVGDGLNDVEAGKAAGCRTILVTKLKLEQIERFVDIDEARPDFIAADLGSALRVIGKGK